MYLTKNILGLILSKLDYKSVQKLVLLLVLVKRIDASTNNIWRILFFKKIQCRLGSWFNACKSLSNLGDVYNIRCFQCGSQTVRLPYRPNNCPLCDIRLSVKDTWICPYE